MRKIILSILIKILSVYANLLNILATPKTSIEQNKSILILPPAEFGSLGDEAMVVGIMEYLKDKNFTRLGIISLSPWDKLSPHWDNFNPECEYIEICHHPLLSWRKWFDFIALVRRYDLFCCLGADMMDGKYGDTSLGKLNYVSLARQAGVRSAILGFSFNGKPTQKIISTFKELSLDVKLYARDPVSQERLIQSLERPVELVADLAFLMPPTTASEVLSDTFRWIMNEKSNGRIVVGINGNSMVLQNSDDGAEIDNLIRIYVDAITQIYLNNHKSSFLLIPHDFRGAGVGTDVGLSQAILKALPLEIQSHSTSILKIFSAGEIKFITGYLDMVLSGRMHLAIACLGQGTPVACITYQGKFEGLFTHFELDGMLITPEQALKSDNLSKFIVPLIDKRDSLRRDIELRLPIVKQLAEANLSEYVEIEPRK